MKSALAFTVVLALAGPVHAQSLGERTGINAIVGIGPSTPDFVKEATVGDMFETMSSELAAIRGNQQARDFAVTMNEDHQKSSSELSLTVKPFIDQAPLPFNLDSAHQLKMDKLRTLEGEEFTKQYFKDQVTAHENAVSLFERYLNGGDNAALKAFAQQTLPTLKHHLELAKNLGQ